MYIPRVSPTWKVAVADQAWMLEERSHPVGPPTVWLVAETPENGMEIITVSKIAFTAQRGIIVVACISFSFLLYIYIPCNQKSNN